MAHIDATLVQQVFDVPKREREPHVEHHGVADDLWAGSEVAEWVRLDHLDELCRLPAPLNAIALTGPS